MPQTRLATGTAGARGSKPAGAVEFAPVRTAKLGDRRSRLVVAVVTGLALVTLAACGGDDSGDTDDTDTTEEASGTDATGSGDATTTEPLSPEEEVLAAYEEAMDAVVAAYDPPDPNHPDLLATHAGQALSRAQNLLTENEGEGISVVATTSRHDPEVTRLVDDTATVEDCIFEILEYLDSDTRGPVQEPVEANELTEWRMERRDGMWKIVEGTTKDQGVC